MKATLLGLSLIVVGVAFAPSVLSTPETGRAALMRALAPTVVSVEGTLTIRVEEDGQQQAFDHPFESGGHLVDPSGLVLVGRSVVDPYYYSDPHEFEGLNVATEVASVRVTIPGEPGEHAAVLVAQDSQLGLAFLSLVGLGDRQLPAIDFARTAAPDPDGLLHVVLRMVRRLDHAPFCVDLRAVGKATKPREMWLLRGTGLMDVLGCEPVHTESGHLVGFCAHHRVDPDDADPDTFLVSVTAVQSLVTRALAKAKGD